MSAAGRSAAKVSTGAPLPPPLSAAGSFHFDGQEVPIRPGDTYASALHRAGHRVLSRSFKYHRPRGLYCNSGGCAGCFIDVDGVPSVPACMTLADSGAQATSQNTLGGAKRDALAIVDKVYRRGFDPHGAFTRPRLLNAAFMKSVRFMSGSGRAPTEVLDKSPRGQRRSVAVDELVIGSGSNGLARAAEAAAKGRSVIVIDERMAPGGTARWRTEPETDADLATVQASPHVELWLDALAFGHYGDVVGVAHGADLVEVHASRVTVATGRHDAWPLFVNNDLPGVLSLDGAWRLVGEHGVVPGRAIVVHGEAPEAFVHVVERHGGTIVASGMVTRAHGGNAVEAATVDGKRVPCDTIVCGGVGQPRIELLQQAGAQLSFDDPEGGLMPLLVDGHQTTVRGLHAAFTPAGGIAS